MSEHDRARLDRYLVKRRDGDEAPAGLQSWRVRAITIRGAERIHIDDKVVEAQSDRIAIGILPSALRVLT